MMKTLPSSPSHSGSSLTRREFLTTTVKSTTAVAAVASFPFVSRGRVLGANDRIGVVGR